jgi:septal ring factor EnvC (AmiA/AmiB activator)
MADGVDVERDVYRTLGAVEEGLKRKADASDVQVELRRAVEYTTSETRREVRLVLDRVDALKDDMRRNIDGLEAGLDVTSKKVSDTSQELHDVARKVDCLNADIAEMRKLVEGLANRPRTSVAEWVRWGFLALGVLAAFVTGNWGALMQLLPR